MESRKMVLMNLSARHTETQSETYGHRGERRGLEELRE